jgi:hypothetical protein
MLYMLPVRAANGVPVIWLDFTPIEDGDHINENLGVPLPARGDTTVMWIINEPASTIAAELEAGLERINKPRSNDQNLWMVLGGVTWVGRTFPRMISKSSGF